MSWSLQGNTLVSNSGGTNAELATLTAEEMDALKAAIKANGSADISQVTGAGGGGSGGYTGDPSSLYGRTFAGDAPANFGGSEVLGGYLSQFTPEQLAQAYKDSGGGDKIGDIQRIYSEGDVQGLSADSQLKLMNALFTLTGDESITSESLGLPKPKTHHGSFWSQLGHNLDPSNWRPADFAASMALGPLAGAWWSAPKAVLEQAGVNLPSWFGAGANEGTKGESPEGPTIEKKAEEGGGEGGGGGTGGTEKGFGDLGTLLSAFSPPALNQARLFYDPALYGQLPDAANDIMRNGAPQLGKTTPYITPEAQTAAIGYPVSGQLGTDLEKPTIDPYMGSFVQPVIAPPYFQNGGKG